MLIFGIMTATSIAILLATSSIEDLYSAKGSRSYSLITKLSRKQLAQFYWVNPNKWSYRPVLKKGYGTATTKHKFLLYGDGKQVIRVDLSLLDKIWFFFARHSRKSTIGSLGMQALLESVQKDIDSLREISQAQIREATEQMKSIEDNIKLTLGGDS